jgi:DNA-binding transcriptional LysR family regulator
MVWLGRGADQPAEFTVNFHSAILRLVAEGLGFALLPYTPKLLGESQVSISFLEEGPLDGGVRHLPPRRG